MKESFSAALRAHMAQGETTLAMCWRVTRVDGTVMGFTSHDRDIGPIAGVTYAAASGFEPSAVRSTARLDVDDLDIVGVLDSEGITDADLAAGVYDNAAVLIFVVNWADLAMGCGILHSGWIGEVNRRRGFFQAEMRGLTQKLQQIVGRQYLSMCDAILGDERCGVNVAPYTHVGTVTAVTDKGAFSASAMVQADDYFRRGLLTWSTGANAGRSMEVREFAGGGFILVQPMPRAIEVGDAFSAVRGCSNRLYLQDGITPDPRGCNGFDNHLNFRGFPYLPGADAILQSPDAR